MRKLITLLALFMAVTMCAQSERLDYYQHIKTVRANGSVETLSGNAGQFVKRTRQYAHARCYDATSRGLDHLNGTLSYTGNNGSREVYKGSSYWGAGTIYQFDDEKGYLNVKDANGNVYVFRRTSAPSGRTRSSYLKKGASVDGWDGVSEWNKIQANNPNNYDNGSSGSSSGSKVNSKKAGSNSSRTCSHCHGTKRIRAHVGTGGYGVSNKKKKCNTCGEWYDPSCDHWHACPYCK